MITENAGGMSRTQNLTLNWRVMEQIAVAHVDLGVSYKTIAAVLHVEERTVRKYRAGKIRRVRPEVLAKLGRLISEKSSNEGAHGPKWSRKAQNTLSEIWDLGREGEIERLERTYDWIMTQVIPPIVDNATLGRMRGLQMIDWDKALLAYAYLREFQFAPRHLRLDRRRSHREQWQVISKWLERLMLMYPEQAWSLIERWKIVTDRVIARWNELSRGEREMAETLDFVGQCEFFEIQAKYHRLVPGNHLIAYNILTVASGTRQRKYYAPYYPLLCVEDSRWGENPINIEAFDPDLTDLYVWVQENQRRSCGVGIAVGA